MDTIAYLTSRMQGGRTETFFVPREGIGLQEILQHDTAAVMALRQAREENQRLRNRVAMLEKLVRAREVVEG